MLYKLLILTALFITATGISSCRKKGCTDPDSVNYDPNAKKDDGSCATPTPYNLEIPPIMQQYLPPPYLDPDNPLTEEGVELGRKLFYDDIVDGTSGATPKSCGLCHRQETAFGSAPSATPLMNLAWADQYKWNGKVKGSTEDLMVFEMEVFMNTDVNRLNEHPEYPELFRKAFGVKKITQKHVEYAMAQFFRTLMSGNSKFDRYLLGQETLTPEELSGFDIFMDESGGDCFHCHGDPTNPLWTDNSFHNNGLDTSPDNGLAGVTGDPNDIGKFKTPTLRNLAFTAPYMHDERFNTLEEVIMHYSIGLQSSPTIDPLMKNVDQGGVQLSPQEINDLKAFLLTLTDSSFIENPNFSNPFE